MDEKKEQEKGKGDDSNGNRTSEVKGGYGNITSKELSKEANAPEEQQVKEYVSA